VRFALSEDQIEFRDAVRGLLADTCTPEAVRAAWESGRDDAVGASDSVADGRVPEAWNALAEMGVLGIMVPEAHGGLGMSDDDMVPLLIECGRAGLPDPVAATAYVAAGYLADAGGSVAAALLERIAAGDVTVGVGFGANALVANAATADMFLMADGLGAGAVHLLDREAVELQQMITVDGARAVSRVAWSAADGIEIGSGAGALLNRAAVGNAALLGGLGRTMLEMTVGYVAERRQFGVPIGSFQAVKHHLTNASLAVEFAEPLALRAANSLTNNLPDVAVHASMAKAKASDAARGAAAASLQCHGAIGYTVEYDLHLYMKRAWALAAEAGDSEFHRARVRPYLLG